MFLLSLFDLKTFKRINLFLDCWFSITEYPELERTCENCWVQLLAPQRARKVNETGREVKAGIYWEQGIQLLSKRSFCCCYSFCCYRNWKAITECRCYVSIKACSNTRMGFFFGRDELCGKECAKDAHRFTLKITQELRKRNLHDPGLQIFYCYLQSYKVDKIGDCGFNMML